jgi:hypothetical protein
MTYDITVQLPCSHGYGQGFWMHLRTCRSERAARAFCSDVANFPADTVNFAIVREDGHFIHDSSRDGLL